MINFCESLILYNINEECCLELTDKYGGDPQDVNIISFYLNNIKNTNVIVNYGKKSSRFKISDKNLNKKKIERSNILGNGFFSTVMIIESTDGLHTDLLVLKISLVKKIDLVEQYNWNHRFYHENYITQKNIVNNFLGDCYYYGDYIKRADEALLCGNINHLDEIKSISYEQIFKKNYEDKFNNNNLSFSIYKFYDKNLERLDIKGCILKLCSVLFYIVYNLRIYLCDFRYDNISFDKNQNIVLIDYDIDTFNKYYKDGDYILWKRISLKSFNPVYIKKKFSNKLGLNTKEGINRIKSHIDNKDDKLSLKTKLYIITSNLIELNSLVTKHKLKDSQNYYYNSNFNPNFENFNLFSLIDILLKLFFINDLDILYLLYQEKLGNFKLNPVNKNDLPFLLNIQNLNDIKILTKYVHEFIQPKQNFDSIYITAIKYLLFDPVTEFGLFGCDFENTPYLGLIFKYLFSLYNPHQELDLYQVFKRMLDENIGTDEISCKEPSEFEADLNKYFKMDYIGEDILRLLIDIDLLQKVEIPRNQPFSQTNYEIVSFARLVELLMDRPENRSDTNLEIPPQNSTLPQNYVKFINKETCEIKTIKKWIENWIGGKHYIINPDIEIHLSNLTFELYELPDSSKKELDNHPLRKLGFIIKDYLYGKKVEIDHSIKYKLKEPFKSSFTKLVDLINRGETEPLISSKLKTDGTNWMRATPLPETPPKVSKWHRAMPLPKPQPGKSRSTRFNKYIKYKNKYLELKNKIINL